MITTILNIATLLLIIGMAWHIWQGDEQDQMKKQRRPRDPKHK
jgi:hypothetical protein